MTNPSITHTHGYLIDTITVADWTESRTLMGVGDAELSVLYDDVIQIKAVSDSTGELEECWYSLTTPIAVSPIVYPKLLFRWKTSDPSLGFGAKIRIKYATGPTYQTVLGESSPEYSTTWKIGTADLLQDKGDITNIFFHAAEDAADNPNGTYYVYYDFLLIHAGTFTFPNVAHDLDFRPPPRYAIIPIPGRVGDITQNLGSELATVTCSCDLDRGDEAFTDTLVSKWKRPQGEETKTDYVNGEVFVEIAHRSYTEPFQWLDTGKHQFKVTLDDPVFRYAKTGTILDLLFREYRRSSASNETYVERFGLNL